MEIVIIGGGIGGLCAAAALQKQGISVQVFDANPEFLPVGAGIGIGSNAMHALADLGIGEEVFRKGYVLQSLVFQNKNGKLLKSIDFLALSEKSGQKNITIHRAHLHRTFIDTLIPGTLHYRKKCISVEQDSERVTAFFADGTHIEADLLIAADGIHSPIRQKILPKSKPRYAGYTCWRGISDNLGKVEEFTSRELWSTKGRFGVAPMKDGKIYWFACVNSPARNPLHQNLAPQEVAKLFSHFLESISHIIRTTLPKNMLHHDIMDIKPLARFVYGKVVLLGDAAHATTPNMGQGAGQAIEDAICLANGFEQFADVEQILRFYEEKRVARTAKVIRLSRQIGAAAQLQSLPLAAARDFLFSLIPSVVLQRRLKFLYDVELN
ncbi:FAD-dependent monooxygenase [Planomicrobium sp. CPCC 101079]|uniref:FAD-dependent monooxygenase n=1 Tax=Planomicrobium sp. CPCC 101079 TaxID=2599618 RepID=UPI001646BB82|nr:FAD-dependent monooxygenase [Planomicrobium sp. CPCC 101079]